MSLDQNRYLFNIQYRESNKLESKTAFHSLKLCASQNMFTNQRLILNLLYFKYHKNLFSIPKHVQFNFRHHFSINLLSRPKNWRIKNSIFESLSTPFIIEYLQYSTFWMLRIVFNPTTFLKLFVIYMGILMFINIPKSFPHNW